MAKQLAQGAGLVVTERDSGDVVVDFAGGPYVVFTAAKWRALRQALDRAVRRPGQTGTGWPAGRS